MPDLLASVLATPGLMWLIGAALVAGTIHGFAGFGSAMVYLPVAGQWLNPFEALTTLMVMDMIGPLPNVPRTLRQGHMPDVVRLSIGLLVALPLGVFVLTLVPAQVFRYGVSLIAIFLLILLISGVRYRGTLSNRMVFGTGALGGFLGGSVGLPGPPVIMLYMTAAHPPPVIRANAMLYLLFSNVVMIFVLALFGELVLGAVGLGLLLAVPYLAANILGGRLFRPGAEKIYRAVAYAIIAVSALSGLPVFD